MLLNSDVIIFSAADPMRSALGYGDGPKSQDGGLAVSEAAKGAAPDNASKTVADDDCPTFLCADEAVM